VVDAIARLRPEDAERIAESLAKVRSEYDPSSAMYAWYMQSMAETCARLLGETGAMDFRGDKGKGEEKDEDKGARKASTSLDFDGMRRFLGYMEDTYGDKGLAAMGEASDKLAFNLHDELLHGGQHHGIRPVRLRQLYNDVRDKLLEHEETLS
jgi:hypothetical protein